MNHFLYWLNRYIVFWMSNEFNDIIEKLPFTLAILHTHIFKCTDVIWPASFSGANIGFQGHQ